MRYATFIPDLIRDLRFGCRSLRKSLGFTVAVVLILGLGIGANAAIFSIVEAALLRPLPFPNADQLVAINSTKPSTNLSTVSPADLRDWSEQSTTMQIAAFSGNGMTLREDEQVENVYSARITEKFFDVLDVRPMVGRTFDIDEWSVKGPRAVVLSHRLWRRRFGGDPSIVGKRLKTGETVVGVMPESFNFPAGAEAWNPIYRDTSEMNRRAARYWIAIGRLRPGHSLDSARAEMRSIGARLAAAYPTDDKDWSIQVLSLRESLVRNFRQALLILMGAVGFILLIACANVAGLMLARSTARRREVTVRLAIGASRSQLIRQFLVEGVMLSALGATVGIVLARGSINALFHLLPNTSWTALVRIREEVQINASVIVFTLTVATAIALLFGLLPALSVMRRSIAISLRNAAVKTQNHSENRFHKALVVVQFACAVLLLAGAGLLIQSFFRMQRVDHGYDPSNLAIMQLPQPRQNPQSFRDQVMERIRATPGVESAAVMSFTSFGALNLPFNIEGNPLPDGDIPVRYSSVSADYFSVLKARLLVGREFDERDSPNAPPVAMINNTLARQYFPGENPIGKKIVIAYDSQRTVREIIGIVSDIRQDAPREPVKPEIFVHWPQLPWLSAVLVMRTQGNPSVVGKAVQQAILSVDKTLPTFTLQTVESMLGDQVAEPRLYVILLGAFAAAAVLLAMIGIYGMLSYLVSRRSHDMAIRIAIGARSADVVRFVVGEGMLLSIAGIGFGLAAALALTRLMKSLLFGVTPTDPWTFVGVTSLLCAVAFLASYIPAHRASRVDPTVALRQE